MAVELSSVSGGNAASLLPKAAPLAVAIARGVGAFRGTVRNNARNLKIALPSWPLR